MGKRIMITAIIFIIVVMAPTSAIADPGTAAAQNTIQILVKGNPLILPTPPSQEKGSTMVPLEPVAKALGAKIEWKSNDEGMSSATLTRLERTATLTIGSPVMIVDGRTVQLNAVPREVNSAIFVPLRAISESLGAVVTWDAATQTIRIDDPVELPAIGTTEKLREILKQTENNNRYSEFIQFETRAVVTQDSAASASPAPSNGDYSQTNVQIAGVDEADWAKTDGRFIYQLSGLNVLISDIADPTKPKLAATIDYSTEEGFNPQELYIDDQRLIVIGQQRHPVTVMTQENQNKASEFRIWPPQPINQMIKAIIYKLDDAGKPKLERTVELEGNYISSRKIGSALYMVTNKYQGMYYPMVSNVKSDTDLAAAFEPKYSDSAISGELKRLPLDSIRYFPESSESNLLLVGAIDLEHDDQEMQVSAFLGSGQTIYASTKHLYVAVNKTIPTGSTWDDETHVHKFRLDHGNVVYVGKGSVPGKVLNQFSMDEHEGYFRIATTRGNMWASDESISKNNVYVLDEQLQTVGKLEDLAPGERIYSARFMGNRAYMVTFRNVDPLFAIDLRNPAKPAVLGQLKIPGYSDYLHPYDEHHLIGFGKETIEVPLKGSDQDASMAYYLGMKIALFDVTDVNHPKEKFKEIIGDRGTHSELLNDHKALLFSREKGLLAFPVQLMEVKNKQLIEPGGFPAYGEFTYQGAYVYHIDLQKGFDLRGRITHLSAEDFAKSGQFGFDYSKSVRRILYAGNTLYTLSDRILKANDMSSLAERGTLTYPVTESSHGGDMTIMPVPMPMTEPVPVR